MEPTVERTTSVSETGHDKNLSNYKKVIINIISFGGTYLPVRPELTAPEMEKSYEKCEAAVIRVGAAKAAYKKALDARNTVFEPLNKLVTRVINALKASATTDHIDKSARELARKIQGIRATAKRSEEEKKADEEAGIKYNEVSASQLSYENRAGNFRNLVQLLGSIPEYHPNEIELQVKSLIAHSSDLNAKNVAVFEAMAVLNNARAERNDLMYKPVTGMVDIALDVKSYLKSVYGPTSLQYKKVAGLDFTRYKI